MLTRDSIVLALDPGETVGWASYRHASDPEQRYKVGEVPRDQVWGLMNTALWTFSIIPGTQKISLTLVAERFKGRFAALDTIEVIGVVKEWGRQQFLFHECDSKCNGGPVHFQGPDQAKFYWTNDRLKELGLYQPKKKHAMDALRHLLYYLFFTLGEKEVGSANASK